MARHESRVHETDGRIWFMTHDEYGALYTAWTTARTATSGLVTDVTWAELQSWPVEVDQFKNMIDQARAAERAKVIERAIEWVRLHTSGISAPNERDLEEMREWCVNGNPYKPAHLASGASGEEK
jgi:hypothetical protein